MKFQRCKFFDEIVKVENLDKEINRINKKYNLSLNSNFSSNHWKKVSINEDYDDKIDYVNLKFNEIRLLLQNKSLPPYHVFYNNKDVRPLIEKYYSKDIELFFSLD